MLQRVVRQVGLSPSSLSRLLSSAGSRVVEIFDQRQYEAEIEQAKDASELVVVDFTAAWCGPCRMMTPVLDALSGRFEKVRFLKVDIDNKEMKLLVARSQISGVPTFHFIKDGEIVQRVAGADKAAVEKLVEELS